MIPQDLIPLAGVLVAGISVGWLLRGGRIQRKPPGLRVSRARTMPVAPSNGSASDEAANPHRQFELAKIALARRQRVVQRREEEVAKGQAEVSEQQRELERLRAELDKGKKERAILGSQLGELRAHLRETGVNIYRTNQELIRSEDEMKDSLDALKGRSHELAVLEKLGAGYVADLNEMVQEVQLQDGELTRLQELLKTRRGELEDARSLLARHETELEDVIRARQAVEQKVAEAADQLTLVTSERNRLLARLQDIADDADHRARLLHLLEHEGHPKAGPLPGGVGYKGPDGKGVVKQVPLLPAPDDDLTRISGIGEGYASMLNAAGIHTYRDIANVDADVLREILTAPQWRVPNIEAWVAEARAIVGDRGLGDLLDGESDDSHDSDDGDDGLPDEEQEGLLDVDLGTGGSDLLADSLDGDAGGWEILLDDDDLPDDDDLLDDEDYAHPDPYYDFEP